MPFFYYTKILIINGFLYLGFLLWNYLIREKLSVDFDALTLTTYISYLGIFLMFITVAITKILHIFGYTQKRSPLVVINDYLVKSLLAFNQYFKNKFQLKFLKPVQKFSLILYKQLFVTKIIYITFNILPRTIIIACFLYDILILNKLVFFYKSLLLGLLPLALHYFIFNFKELYESQYKLIDECIDIVCYSEGKEIYAEAISLKFYIENHVRIRLQNTKELFNCAILLKSTYVEKALLHMDTTKHTLDYKKSLVKFRGLTESLIRLKLVLNVYQSFSFSLENSVGVLLHLAFTLCWGYVIILATPNILMMKSEHIVNVEEPFSQIFL